MFFILSKILIYILMPSLWILVILLYAFFTKSQKRRKRSILICLLLFFVLGNGFLLNKCMLLWEKEPLSIASLPVYDTGIVLTGITDSRRKPHDRVYFTRGADRLLHTVQLHKMGKIKKILISGGSGLLVGEKVSEAGDLKKAFLYCGVPEKDILIEDKSRNTRESSVLSKRMVDSLNIKGNFLLITSAFHMRRSEGCFEKAGFKITGFPVDFYTNTNPPALTDLIPSTEALGGWSLLIHEITGYLTYKIMGYC
jgi:uncharacterized SAM-binding protein YcdF (DUF218 family)